MNVVCEVQLDERCEDRVTVIIGLAPSGEAAVVDGVAVELVGRSGESLGPRQLLPIHGALTGPITTRVELRASGGGDIPLGCTVVATIWSGVEQTVTECTADPWTEFPTHVFGKRPVPLESSRTPGTFASATRADRARLAKTFPWMTVPPPPPPPPKPDDDLFDDLGLDYDDAAFLRDLLVDDDDAFDEE